MRRTEPHEDELADDAVKVERELRALALRRRAWTRFKLWLRHPFRNR